MTELDPELLRNIAVYPVVVQENVRYRDCDLQRHVNNAVFATYFEIGRSVAMREAMAKGARRPKGTGGSVVRQIINYHGQVRYPSVVQIGTGILRIGRTSFAYGSAVFCNGECAASGEVTTVLTDRETGRPVAIPDDYRATLESIGLRRP
ncbi:MAG TPA: thioesterase family protein [Burkholderiales bacterium]|nr:thioesterase family protein [Burkholderiales bacterium]